MFLTRYSNNDYYGEYNNMNCKSNIIINNSYHVSSRNNNDNDGNSNNINDSYNIGSNNNKNSNNKSSIKELPKVVVYLESNIPTIIDDKVGSIFDLI